MRFKNIEGKPERESPKKTISASSGFGLLQMVSEPDTSPARRLSPEGGWTQGSVLTRKLGLEGDVLGGSHLNRSRERVPARTLGPE